MLKESDPRLAAYCLKMAEADWRFARAGMAATNATAPSELWRGTFDSDNVEHETAAVGVLASVDLWQVTGSQRYADKAIELAGIILASQERKRPNWDIPLLGFFYTGPAKDRILHYCHRGREQAPILALTRLCDAFPNHPDWMKWYSAVALYSQYLKAAAKYTEPYGVMPASIYQADEYRTVPETRRESFRNQVLNGIPLGRGPLPAAVSGLDGLSRAFRDDSAAGPGADECRTPARRPGSGDPGAASGRVDYWPESVLAKHHVRRRL